MKGRLIIIIFLLLAAIQLAAQTSHFRFDRLTVREGLPSDNTRKIIQDKQGFIWIATSEGLCRYDGYHIITFTANPAIPHSLVNNYIYDLSEDENGNIWITTAGGWCELLYNSQTFLNINDFKSFSGKRPDFNPEFILADGHQHIIMGGYTGSFIMNLTTRGFEHFQTASGDISFATVLSYIMQDKQGQVWLGFIGGTGVYDPVKNRVYNSGYSSGDLLLTSTMSPLLIQGNTVWFSKWGDNVYIYNKQTHTLKALGKDTSGIKELAGVIQPKKMIVDKAGHHWLLLADKGVYYMDFAGNQFHLLTNAPGDINSIPSQMVRDILCDHEGNIWVATDKGIARRNNQQQNFEQVLYGGRPLQQCLPVFTGNFQINDVLEDGGQVLIGATPIGLLAMDTAKAGIFRRIQINTGNRVSAMNQITNYILKDKDGNIWLCTQEGYATYNRKKDNLTPYFVLRNDITRNPFYQVSMMTQDSSGLIWLASKKGLGKLDPVTGRIAWFPLPATYKTGLPFYVKKIIPQHDSVLWLVTTEGGLFSFNKNTRAFARYAAETMGDKWKPFNDCIDAVIINDTLLMMATQFNGLIRFNPVKKTFRQFTTSDGLASNNIRGIVTDAYKGLWIATMNGLSRLNLNTNTFSQYGYSNGLIDPSFPSDNSFYQEPDGNILLLDGAWLLRFNPAAFAGKVDAPPVFFTSVEQFGKPVFYPLPVRAIKDIHLSPDDRYLTIRFSTLQFKNTSQTQYAVRLEGLDNDWHLTHLPAVSYSNLADGSYTLLVKASMDAISWSAEQRMVIVVRPVFWKTGWFMTLLAAVIVVTLFLFYRMRVNRLRNELYLRNKIARDLHDDVGATLSSLHMVSALAAKKIIEDPAKAKELLEKITTSSERMTGNMQDIVWAVNPGNDSFSRIIARMQEFAAQTLEAKNISLDFEAGDALKRLNLPLQYRSDLFMLFKEAVNNIAKHSQANHVWIHLSKNNKRIFLSVRDDGTGFDSTTAANGNGLRNMQERAKNLAANFAIETAPSGTTVRLDFSI